MPDSRFSRFWNLVKPPEPVKRPGPAIPPKVLELRRRQRRLVMISVAVLAVLAAGAAVASYIGSAPQRADKEFQEGMKLMHPGKYADAVVHFTRTLNISPQRPEAYLERGNAHNSLGESDAALADFQAAADLNPSLADAHNGIALIYVERHDSRHALEEFNKSIVLQPTIEAYYQRGEILEAQGEHRKAIDDYDQAIALARDAPYVYLARAMAKANQGDEEGARADRAYASTLQR
jgi:tetratricopeptide (TPR) repeat protein